MSHPSNPQTIQKTTQYYQNIYNTKKSYLDSCQKELIIYQNMLKDNDLKNDRQAQTGIKACEARIREARASFDSFFKDCQEMHQQGRINKFW